MHGKGPVCMESRRRNNLPLPENDVLKCKKGSYKHTKPAFQSDEQNIPGNTYLGIASGGKWDSRVLERDPAEDETSSVGVLSPVIEKKKKKKEHWIISICSIPLEAGSAFEKKKKHQKKLLECLHSPSPVTTTV